MPSNWGQDQTASVFPAEHISGSVPPRVRSIATVEIQASGDIRCILWGMNMKLVSSLMLCGWVAFLTGCIATADGHTKAGIPLAKDTITTRFDRAASQVQT